MEPPSEVENVPFHKKPIYYWLKSFAEREIQREESFSKFLGSNALTNALEYLGITNEGEQSSLHLSAIFDEENSSGSFSRKLCSQFESETKSRIHNLNRVFNELASYFEDNFSQLVLTRVPNTVHIATSCISCSALEFEKILFLLLGAAIKGEQKQETIRRVKGFPSDIQEALIATIKVVTDTPEVIDLTPWTKFSSMEAQEQKRIYDNLLSVIRRTILERNSAIQTQLLSDYCCGYTNCYQSRTYEMKSDSDLEKNSDDNRTSAALRQLREELLEKSDLLQECREELEMTKQSMQQIHQELTRTQQELKNCKKARDEVDVLREGQEKAVRLEAELQRMRKKLENSEQYFERIEILQSENRNFQLKHAILMDQINMLTVDKERLEVSFMTQNHHRNQDLSDPEADVTNILNSSGSFNIGEELLMDSDDECKSKPTLEDEPPPADPDLEDKPAPDDTDNQTITPKSARPANTKRTKRRHKRASGLNVKRNRKTMFTPTKPSAKVVLQPAETEAETAFKQRTEQSRTTAESDQTTAKKSPSSRSKRAYRELFSQRRRSSEKQVVPQLDLANDADEELSLSPNPIAHISSSSSNTSSGNEVDTETLVPQLIRRPSLIEPNNNETGTESDNEFFFVCSAPLPSASNRNLKIANGKTIQIANSRKQSDGSQEDDDEEQSGLGNCNIHLNLHQINNHSLNLSQGHNPNQTSYRATIALASSPGVVQDPDSSSEDDDSVWYEYGCV